MEKTIKQWVEEFNKGDYSMADVNTQVSAGWYDWFCKDSSLMNKTKKFGNILKDIKSENILNNFRIWFKNNCPVGDPLYDDMRFEPLDESRRDDFYFLVSIDCGYEEKKYTVYTARNGFEKPEFKCATKKELLAVIEKLGEELK